MLWACSEILEGNSIFQKLLDFFHKHNWYKIIFGLRIRHVITLYVTIR